MKAGKQRRQGAETARKRDRMSGEEKCQVGIRGLIKQMLTEQENKRYRRQLSDRQMSYAAWLGAQEKVWAQEETPNREMLGCCAAADGDFVLLVTPDGAPTSYAKKNITRYFMENPETMVVYGDEDIQDEDGVAREPWFKPDWSPDFFDGCFYLGNLVAVRRSLWEQRMQNLTEEVLEAVGILKREGTEAAKVTEKESAAFAASEEAAGCCAVKDIGAYERLIRELTAEAYARGSRMVGHIPQILFHADSDEAQERFLRKQERQPDKRQEREEERVHETRQVCGMSRTEEEPCLERSGENEGEGESVSVIIPSKDQPELLRECIGGIIRCGGGSFCEILVVDNGSSRENREKVEKLLQELTAFVPCRYLYEPMPFNFSRMCNLGAGAAKGKLLLFLNDDVTLALPGSLAEMAELAARDYTGAVGMKLLYPDSGRIQHAGITNLPMGPVHKLQFCADGEPYYGRANCCRRNVLAVTAACLMVKKERFEEAGGFPEELQVAFNDVSLCFALHELGYFNVCLNDRYALHHESLSRGADESPEKLQRLLAERGRLYERHPALAGCDPYYSVHLNRRGLDTRIAPAYVTAAARVQKETRRAERMNLKDCREDACLLLRIEDFREREMTGYGVVLGDNNACYEKVLLLQSAGEKQTAGVSARLGENAGEGAPAEAVGLQTVYGVSADGQYRPDLEENLSDQKNVALSGFWLQLGRGVVPPGRYRVGMLARNRVTGLRLLGWSNRYLEL